MAIITAEFEYAPPENKTNYAYEENPDNGTFGIPSRTATVYLAKDAVTNTFEGPPQHLYVAISDKPFTELRTKE